MTDDPAGQLAQHLADCRDVQAALVGDTGVDMTPTVEMLIAEGWTYEGIEFIGDKRVRYLRPPPGEERKR